MTTTTEKTRVSLAESLRGAITEEMARDPKVFCLGEDIAVPGGWGGAFTVTLGLEERFPDRMINTPIAELGFFGVGAGAALMGMRPIVDVQYGDFLFLATEISSSWRWIRSSTTPPRCVTCPAVSARSPS